MKSTDMKKRLFAFLLALCMIFALAACGDSGDGNADDPNADGTEVTLENVGTVYVGIDGAYPPYCFLNENDEVDGFEVAVMKEIAERNNIEIECQITAWNSMFGQLDSGRIDTVAENVSINAERAEKYNIAGTYAESNNRFLVQGGKESSISTFEDLAGKKIGVASGSTAYNQLEELKKEYNIDFEIVPYDSSTNAYDVSIGRIDASYMSPVVGMSLSKESNLGLAIADVEAYVTDYCGYLFVKDSPRADLLRETFEKTLQEMAEDGTLSELSVQWLGLDISHVESADNLTFN